MHLRQVVHNFYIYDPYPKPSIRLAKRSTAVATAYKSSPVSEQVDLRRLLWVGPLAIVAALAANAVVRAIALAVLDVPATFMPLASMSFVGLTIAGVLGAVIVFAIMAVRAKTPITTFRKVAFWTLLATFVPDIGLLFGGGGNAPGSLSNVLTLMLMHVVAYAISVTLLTTLTRKG
jgi:hypothetical protein